MSRSTPYFKKPIDSWKAGIEALKDTTLYLVARPAPIIFSIKNSNDSVFKVTLGNPHTCTCGCKINEFCPHILFCLTKVLRIPVEDTLCWQRSFTDNEIDDALKKETEFRAVRRVQRVASRTATPSGEASVGDSDVVDDSVAVSESGVKRHLLDGDEADICPICQDSMSEEGNQLLTWCRKGCGKNIHANCMKMLVQYEMKRGGLTEKFGPKTILPHSITVECPLCRTNFDLESLKDDCKAKLTPKYQSIPVRCCRGATGCYNIPSVTSYFNAYGNVKRNSSVIESDFFRCIECSNGAMLKGNKPVDFCHKCFNSQSNVSTVHFEHHFINSNGNIADIREVEWVPFTNPFCGSSKAAVAARRSQSGSRASSNGSDAGNLSGSDREDDNDLRRRRREQLRNQLRLPGASGAIGGVSGSVSNPQATVASAAASTLAEIIATRELTPDDYDLLLQLNDHSVAEPGPSASISSQAPTGAVEFHIPEIPDLCKHLLSSLPTSSMNPIETDKECWCSFSGGDTNPRKDPVEETKYKRLLCGHLAHEDCVLKLMQSFTEPDEGADADMGPWKLFAVYCKHPECNKMPLFPCLNRKKIKSPKISTEGVASVDQLAVSSKISAGGIAPPISAFGSGITTINGKKSSSKPGHSAADMRARGAAASDNSKADLENALTQRGVVVGIAGLAVSSGSTHSAAPIPSLVTSKRSSAKLLAKPLSITVRRQSKDRNDMQDISDLVMAATGLSGKHCDSNLAGEIEAKIKAGKAGGKRTPLLPRIRTNSVNSSVSTPTAPSATLNMSLLVNGDTQTSDSSSLVSPPRPPQQTSIGQTFGKIPKGSVRIKETPNANSYRGLNVDGIDGLIVGSSIALNASQVAEGVPPVAVASQKRTTGKIHKKLPSKIRIDRQKQISSMEVLSSNANANPNLSICSTTPEEMNLAGNIEMEFDDEV